MNYEQLKAEYDGVNEDLHAVRALVKATSEDVRHDIQRIMDERDALKELVSGLLKDHKDGGILHGEDQHRKWLKEHIELKLAEALDQ